MRIGIYTNLTKDTNGKATNALIEILNGLGAEVYLYEKNSEIFKGYKYYNKQNLGKKLDALFTLGGDGTILRVAKECAAGNVKIFAINLGFLGFLSETEIKDLETACCEILKGGYSIDKRDFLEAEYNGTRYTGLNEAIVERAYKAKMLKTEVKIDGAPWGRYNSDGIIIATPTGSTAYSLSAGGPIAAPDVDAFIISPICPHSLYSRPLIVNNRSVITVKITDTDNRAVLVLDGGKPVPLDGNAEVKIKKSDLTLSFIRTKRYNFYEKLLEKMCRWSNTENIIKENS